MKASIARRRLCGTYLRVGPHVAVAGAAGFEAMKAYENHLKSTGQEPSHPVMKEMLAAFAAAEVDKLVETKGAPSCARLARLAS